MIGGGFCRVLTRVRWHAVRCLEQEEPANYKDLVPSFVSILKQITEHRLPKDFDYHRIPAPWIQMQLLRILATLGQADQVASEGMYEVLLDVMRRADTGISVGYAIIYECVRTVTTIYPNATLLDAAAASIARFISSDNHNLKYLGVTGLAAIVKDHPKYAAEHQLAVIDCLEDPDETLKRKVRSARSRGMVAFQGPRAHMAGLVWCVVSCRLCYQTLDLLFRMTNPVNVEVVTSKLLSFLRSSVDVFLRKDLVSRITQVAERFAPNNQWYILTMTEVFELGGDLVDPEVANNLMRLIAEGVGEDEESDAELRRFVVEQYLGILDKPGMPDILMQTVFWVLGEYAYMSPSVSLEDISEKLCAVANRANADPTTRGYAISAALKLTAQLGRLLPCAASVVDRFTQSQNVDVAQRCREFRELSTRPDTMVDVLPVDASMEDIEVDEGLSFLNGYVQQQVANGARQYSPPADDLDDEADANDTYVVRCVGCARCDVTHVWVSVCACRLNHHSGGLRFEAYETPEEPTGNYAAAMHAATDDAAGAGGAGSGAGASTATARAPTGLNVTGVKSVWGESGYAGGDTSAGATASAVTPPLRHQAAAKRPWDYSGPEVAAAQQAEEADAGSNNNQEEAAQDDGRSASGSISIQPRAGHTPVKPRELTEREKMAAALFGGIAAAPAPSPAPASPTPRAGRLGRIGARAGSAAAPSPAPAPAPPAPADDLLGLMGGMDLGASAPAPAPAPAAASAGGLGDLFSMPSGGAGAGAGSGGDMFGSSGGGAGAPDVANFTYPPAVAAVATGRRASAANAVLGNDSNLYLGANKIWNVRRSLWWRMWLYVWCMHVPGADVVLCVFRSSGQQLDGHHPSGIHRGCSVVQRASPGLCASLLQHRWLAGSPSAQACVRRHVVRGQHGGRVCHNGLPRRVPGTVSHAQPR